jgi:beta-glucosidase
VFPEVFRDELVELTKRYRLPVYVTENGCGGSDVVGEDGRVNDRHRITYLSLFTKAMAEAMAAGADVRGYFVWSLLDSFEWGSGYTQRFGLVHVDFATLRRTPKASAGWFKALISGSKGSSPPA